MRLAEFMSTDVIAVSPGTDAERAWSMMRTREVRHLVVMDGRHVEGVLSDRDLGGRSGGSVRRGRTVADLMSRHVVEAGPTTTIRQAANLMRGRTIGCLPVVEDGRVVGIVTITDILDQLGRGATRPAVRAQRQVRRAPAGHHDLGDTPRQRVTSRQAKLKTPPARRRAHSKAAGRG